MWESISSGAVVSPLKIEGRLERGGGKQRQASKDFSWLHSPSPPFSVFLGSDEVWI